MKIRSKIILVVLPLIVVTVVLAGTASFFSAINGVNRIARELLSYKAQELQKYAQSQWDLLESYGYTNDAAMVDAAKEAVKSYAQTMAAGRGGTSTELIFALDKDGKLAMMSGETPGQMSNRLQGAQPALLARLRSDAQTQGISKLVLPGPKADPTANEKRIAAVFYFKPFDWYVAVSELDAVFYQDAYAIAFQTLAVLVLALLAGAVLLILFANKLSAPLSRMAKTMNSITSGGDLGKRVEVEYKDETGKLAGAFNVMLSALQSAYAQIRRHAFDAVLAGKREQRIRQIFQKYVPRTVIDRFFASPESMLVGENRNLAILFSDIRSFTSISENLAPDELVQQLNKYFSGQVDIIMGRGGVIDKYIGDAIMAFWGAPVQGKDDALQAALAALDMQEALSRFNAEQEAAGKKPFRIGIGINYGTVTVGNIGSERKMDYTVIGDPVNLASRLEGLTKVYHEPVLVSEFLYNAMLAKRGTAVEGAKKEWQARLLDTVEVVGKKQGVKIYALRRSLDTGTAQAWLLSDQGMALYYKRDFKAAAAKFQAVLSLLPDDVSAAMHLDYSRRYIAAPPPPAWNGVEVIGHK